jgi:hypothetical protein
MTTPLRDYLANELGRKVSQRGIVVWQDSEREYSDVAESLCPTDARFVAHDGSWYALRRDVETLLGGDRPPKLVVYLPEPPIADDPVEEIRASGVRFAMRLNTLVKNALKGQLSEQRLVEIGSQARTLPEAEAAIGGDTGADVRLIGILGASDTRTMALRILTGDRAEAIDDARAWEHAASMLSTYVGGSLAGDWDDLRQAALRQMVLTELHGATDALPRALVSAWAPVSADQRRRTSELLRAWQEYPDHREDYGALAHRVDDDLGLPAAIRWSDGLAECTSTPAIEEVAFRESVDRLEQGDPLAAAALAERRLSASPWVRPYGPAGDAWAPAAARWRAAKATSDLLAATAGIKPPARASAADLLSWYVEDGWRTDRAHRRFEIARNDLRVFGELEQAFTSARVLYEEWLESTLRAFTTAVERGGVDGGTLSRQGDIHLRWVRDAEPPVAYVWVDALRFELAAELADGLRADGHTPELHATIGAIPTITPVGMANLTPGAGTGLTLYLDSADLAIEVDGARVATVPDRVARLRAAHGDKVLDRTLELMAGPGEREIERAIGDANLVLIRSQELDAAGESGMLNAAWSQFTAVLELLRNVVAKLGQAGIRRIVIAADHGFVTVSRGLGSNRSIDPPAGGVGRLHRRGWVGRGASTTESTLRVSLASTGVPSDADLIAPRGLAVFRAGGSKQFFHGGLSPQELVVPVIVIDTEPARAPMELRVDVSIAGGRITTGAFAATVEFSGDLFTNEITVRVVAKGAKGNGVVARVVSGDGYDPATGSIDLRSDRPAPVLTFQVTSNLERDATVEVEVLDARTGVRLGSAEANVATKIVVQDELE